jgi:hypothetical protein
MIDRIGLEGSSITHKTFQEGKEVVHKLAIRITDHAAGLSEAARLLSDKDIGVIKSPDELDAVGHRVVHGGEAFSKTMIITDAVKAKIKELFPLAPLHNPPNYLGIEVAEKIFPKATQVAVFDTAFHQTMPPVAFRMAIPNELYEKHQIRAYGFHGTSHELRTPLAALNSSLDLALRTKNYEKGILSAKEDLHEVSSLVERLLELARLDRLVLSSSLVDASELVSSIVDRHRDAAMKRSVTIALHAAPDVRVHADAALLRQLVSNLLTNAMKFSKSEGGTVDVTLSGERLVISDNGIGIANPSCNQGT